MDARDIAEPIDYHVRLREERGRRRLRRDRGPERPRLPDPPVPLAEVQPPGRRVRRQSLENRMRFGVEVLTAVRDAVGDQVAVGIRLVGDDEQCATARAHGRRLPPRSRRATRTSGLVDFLNVSVGTGGIGMVRTNYAPHCLGVYAAARRQEGGPRHARVRRAPDPRRPRRPRAIVERHEADGITLVRALIADPEWVAQGARAAATTRSGAAPASTSRATATCSSRCRSTACRTRQSGARTTSGSARSSPRRVPRRSSSSAAVPAAWRRPWVAAARGHDVTLLEHDRPSSAAGCGWPRELPGRERDRRRSPTGASASASVAASTSASASTADADDVLALEPDAVIVATGGRADEDRSGHVPPDAGAGLRAGLGARPRRRAPTRPRRSVVDSATASCSSTRSATSQAIGLGELLAAAGAGGDLRHAAARPDRARRRDAGRDPSPRRASRHAVATQHRARRHRRPRGDAGRRALPRARDGHRRRHGRDPHPRPARGRRCTTRSRARSTELELIGDAVAVRVGRPGRVRRARRGSRALTTTV